MRTIAAVEALAEITVSRSRFIAALKRVDAESLARDFVAQRRKAHHAARHHAVAWILGPHGQARRAHDDGEPAATAGAPMLSVLSGAGVTDTVAVVTRYFGGTKLGTGGLARAYGSAVSAALESVGTLQQRQGFTVTITCPHQHAGRLEAELHAAGLRPSPARYRSTEAVFDITCTDVDAVVAWLGLRHPAAGVAVTGTTTFTVAD